MAAVVMVVIVDRRNAIFAFGIAALKVMRGLRSVTLLRNREF